ncbi:molecular chaperone Hsp33 [Pacificimonas flava]|uniref:Molecular chaperone Hsp33 n=1 Tax=Pacificimonas flava TaxID=1234595 RepID=A0A219B1F9_9SPHN|nr:molecular chaperone Hsp33 [Pacificimonas flava]
MDQRTEDIVLGFTIPARSGRGRLMRLGDSLNVVLSAHDYPPRLAKLLGEAIILTGLIGSALKGNEGQTTVQARAEGGLVDLLVCDYRAGEVRGYLSFEPEAADLPEGAPLSEIFGTGYLAVTIDPSDGRERYQGIVDLKGDTLAEAAERYFQSSEQIPTILRADVRFGADGWHAGGMLLQHLGRKEEGGPRLHVENEREDWAHLEALGSTVTAEELSDPGLTFPELLWRLFNEDEVRIIPPVPISRGCRCSVPMIEERLSTLPGDQKAEIRDEDGLVRVDCEFCSRQFAVRV